MSVKVRRRPVTALHLRSSIGRYGPERVLLEMVPALHDLGVETRLLALYRAPAGGPDLNPWIAEAGSAGVPADQINDPGPLSMAVLRRLARRIGSSGADILHTHDYRSNILGGLAARRVDRSMPWVATVHLHTVTTTRLKLYRALDLFLLRLSDRVITVSRDQRRLLLSRGVDRQRLVMIPTVVDVDAFSAGARPREAVRCELLLPWDAPVVALLGRLSAQKGVDVLLQAAPAILRSHPTARFLVVGSGPLREKLEGQVRALGLSAHVCFTGYRADAASILGACDVVVLPSRSEGAPVALLEALAMRRPVVASRVGGVPDIVRHGHTGLLVPPEDPGRMAQEVVRLLAEPEFARGLGEAGYAYVSQSCTPERAARRTASVYRSVLAERE